MAAPPLPTPPTHWINGNSIKPPFPAGMETERKFWQVPGVHATAIGYAGGPTPNPTYQEVCSGMTGHNEVVLVVFDPRKVSYETLLKTFWESHDPTQGMRQGIGRGFTSRRRSSGASRKRLAAPMSKASPRPATAPSRPRSSMLRRSRTITSSIWQRIQMVTAASAAPA